MENVEALVERLRANPCVIVEGVNKPSPWREFFINEGFTEMDTDAFLTWLGFNKNLYTSFENATIEYIKKRRQVSAITIMDLIGCDHNRCPYFSRMVMKRIPAAKGYFKAKRIKR